MAGSGRHLAVLGIAAALGVSRQAADTQAVAKVGNVSVFGADRQQAGFAVNREFPAWHPQPG